MIEIVKGQKWLCIKGVRRGTLIEIGTQHTLDAGEFWYTNLSATRARVVGKITEGALRRKWELRNCEHEDVIDDCSICRCPFHGITFGSCACLPGANTS